MLNSLFKFLRQRAEFWIVTQLTFKRSLLTLLFPNLRSKNNCLETIKCSLLTCSFLNFRVKKNYFGTLSRLIWRIKSENWKKTKTMWISLPDFGNKPPGIKVVCASTIFVLFVHIFICYFDISNQTFA